MISGMIIVTRLLIPPQCQALCHLLCILYAHCNIVIPKFGMEPDSLGLNPSSYTDCVAVIEFFNFLVPPCFSSPPMLNRANNFTYQMDLLGVIT